MNLDASQFEKFVGQKVLVEEKKSVYHSKYSGDIECTEHEVKSEDTTIAEIEKEAGFYHLRVWLPSTIGTMELRSDRLNVYVEKQDDGTYEITKVDIG